MKSTLLILALAIATASPILAADTQPASPPTADAPVAKPKPKSEAGKPSSVPFSGKIAAVDHTAQTITLSGKSQRVVKVTTKTKITRDGQPASFADAKVGEPVGGSAKKTEQGQLEAISLRLGAKPATDKAKKPPKTKPTEPAK